MESFFEEKKKLKYFFLRPLFRRDCYGICMMEKCWLIVGLEKVST